MATTNASNDGIISTVIQRRTCSDSDIINIISDQPGSQEGSFMRLQDNSIGHQAPLPQRNNYDGDNVHHSHPTSNNDYDAEYRKALKQIIFHAFFFSLAAVIICSFVVPANFVLHSTKITDTTSLRETIGANATVLLNDSCMTTDLNSIKSIYFSINSTKFAANIYLTNTVNEVPNLLPNVSVISSRSNDGTFGDVLNFGINYYTPLDPIYTAAPGNITYYVTYNTSGAVDCPLKFYLFDSLSSFNNFRDTASDNGFKAVDAFTICDMKNKNGTFQTSAHLSLRYSGFFYVGVSLYKGVSIVLYASAQLVAYYVPPQSIAPKQMCELSSTAQSCSFTLSKSNPVFQQKICILASTTSTANQTLNVVYDRGTYREYDHNVILWGSMSAVASSFCMTIAGMIKDPNLYKSVCCKRRQIGQVYDDSDPLIGPTDDSN